MRSAVVFLHATLEDFLRGAAELRLPLAPREALGKIPFPATKGKDSSFLEVLADHRGRSVDQVITASITSYLDRKTYNGVDEVASLIADVGLSYAVVLKPYAARIAALMARRHHIAHRFDRNTFAGPGQHPARSISKGLVVEWIEAVAQLNEAMVQAIEPIRK